MSEWLKAIRPMTVYAAQDAEKEEHSSTAGGVQTCKATVEISMETPQENANEPTTISSNSTLRHIPKRSTFMQQRYLFNDVHGSTICSSQKLEAA